jgi:hypothetical protein
VELWNRLSRHQERSAPFRLVRVEIPETRECLAHIALIRREELDAFVEGLFGKEQSLELPERADSALDALCELRAIFDGLYEFNVPEPLIARMMGGNAARQFAVEPLHDSRMVRS